MTSFMQQSDCNWPPDLICFCFSPNSNAIITWLASSLPWASWLRLVLLSVCWVAAQQHSCSVQNNSWRTWFIRSPSRSSQALLTNSRRHSDTLSCLQVLQSYPRFKILSVRHVFGKPSKSGFHMMRGFFSRRETNVVLLWKQTIIHTSSREVNH